MRARRKEPCLLRSGCKADLTQGDAKSVPRLQAANPRKMASETLLTPYNSSDPYVQLSHQSQSF